VANLISAPRGSNCPESVALEPMMFDQGEGSEILDAIVAEGRCGTCGTPWDRVVKVESKRPVKIEGVCPLGVCVLATGESLVPPAILNPGEWLCAVRTETSAQL
jgi:hypothetical protein